MTKEQIFNLVLKNVKHNLLPCANLFCSTCRQYFPEIQKNKDDINNFFCSSVLKQTAENYKKTKILVKKLK